MVFLACIFATTYSDHVHLVAKNNELRVRIMNAQDHEETSLRLVKDDFIGRLSTLRESCAKVEGANGILTKQTADQQNTINNCQTQALKLLTPETQKITPLVLQDETTNTTDHKAKFLVLTNKVITPVRMIVGCNRPIKEGSASILGSGVMTGGASNQSPTVLGVSIDSPA